MNLANEGCGGKLVRSLAMLPEPPHGTLGYTLRLPQRHMRLGPSEPAPRRRPHRSPAFPAPATSDVLGLHPRAVGARLGA
jgi:hypothetical protein